MCSYLSVMQLHYAGKCFVHGLEIITKKKTKRKKTFQSKKCNLRVASLKCGKERLMGLIRD